METVALSLSITNLLLHDIEAPNITHCDSLGTNVTDFNETDKVDVIGMNPPYGGSTDDSVKSNFPLRYRSSETADLFIALIMYRLKAGGRCGVIIPDGFLFGTDGAKLALKENLCVISIYIPSSVCRAQYFLHTLPLQPTSFSLITKKPKAAKEDSRQRKHGSIVWICRKDTNISQNQTDEGRAYSAYSGMVERP